MFRNTRPKPLFTSDYNDFNTILSTAGSPGQKLFSGRGYIGGFNTNIVDCYGYEAYFGSRSNTQDKG
jgi:hypothetical protein